MSVQVKEQVQYTAYLEQASGSSMGRKFALNSGKLTVGRSPDCDIVIDAEGLSRVHALIAISEGSWFIRDNNSKNGIYVNGNKVKESWLETGDMLQLGTYVFRFDAGAEIASSEVGGLPQVAGGGALEMGAIGIPGASPSKAKKTNPRILIYVGVIGILGLFLMLNGGSSDPAAPTADGTASALEGEGPLARQFKNSEKPTTELGTKELIPRGMEDPLLKKAEQEMAKLDWSNKSLREAEQFFRRGQREYLNRNHHRAINAFRTALSLYGGHLIAERYLRLAIYEAEIEAKMNMASGIQYYESLQYTRAIHHFNEVIALMEHRPDEAIVKEAQRYIKQSEMRLQAAELFP